MLELCPAGPGDAPSLARLAHGSFQDPWSEDSLRGELESPFGYATLARGAAGEPLGFVVGRLLGEDAELLLIGVAEAERRRGVGRALLERFLADLRVAGARRVTLEVRASNAAALALYRSSGFERWGERPRYYPGGEPGLLLGIEL